MKVKTSSFLVKPSANPRLEKLRADVHPGVSEKASTELLQKHREQLSELQEVLYASQSKAVLLVLQGMDTAGKDGTIRHIFSGINPQGCDVASFKVPNSLEARHDYLWRCHAQVPPRGMIGIFNRSHYEDVLSPVVHGHVDKKTARKRMDEINDWEAMLAANNVLILKFFLHISQKEQTERLQSRIDTPDKHWKLSESDFAERQYWPQYQDAYEQILRHTSKKHAPWFVIPSNYKWFRNVAISQILVDALSAQKLQYPAPSFDPSGINLQKSSAKTAAKMVEARVQLASEKS
ncbi:MAG: polyphosphate kinase 2 family protein [Acidobacteriaceae bacterium]|nr:polyphosphate kinase 2 family protein [Acidobacteriaceae bacterium]